MKNKSQKISPVTQPNTSVNNRTGSWRTQRPVTDNNICVGCSRCAKICPEGCIVMTLTPEFADKAKPVTDYDYCKGCALCAQECPAKAIKMISDYE